MNIPFNKPYLTGKEAHYLYDAVYGESKLSGNGKYTHLCQFFFEQRYGFHKCLLTTSCTDALEMAAILLDIQPGDEIILPSYTFVSTANAFVLRGAHLVFADSQADHPNLDAEKIEPLISPRTKVIVAVHYAGMACDMDKIMTLAGQYDLWVVEDAAQAIDSCFVGKDGTKRPLGGIGHLGAFSFHETKNIIAGEGGMLVVNDPRFTKRAEIIWEKGTDRAAFWRGEVDKYGWVDVGSSFLPSEIIAAFLWAQLEHLDSIQAKRLDLWQHYFECLENIEGSGLALRPRIPAGATNNAHCFYLVFKNLENRSRVIEALKKQGVNAVFHYLSLHSSKYYEKRHDGRRLPHSDRYSDSLLRLPLFFELEKNQVDWVCGILRSLEVENPFIE
jgi:dTDP-4-amino-4,6-dideoxygalactose transaminase